MRIRRAEHRREQALQSADQDVRLATALGQLFDLGILVCEFIAKERNFTFKPPDVSVGQIRSRRDLSRRVVTCRGWLLHGLNLNLLGENCRVLSRCVVTCRCLVSRLVVESFLADFGADLSRQVVTCRGWTNLLNVGNVLSHRRGRDQIFFTERCFNAATIEMAFGAESLNAARRPRMAGMFITLKRLVDG